MLQPPGPGPWRKQNNSPLLGADWSKSMAPTRGCNLTMTSGVMNLRSGNLGGNTLTRGVTRPRFPARACGCAGLPSNALSATASRQMRLRRLMFPEK